MTRGSAYLLLKDKVLESVQFNGGMYPKEYGDKFFTRLIELKDEKDFREFIKDFNKKYFEYNELLVSEQKNANFYDVVTKNELIIDFNHKYLERFNSDWTFFKNLTGISVRFFLTGEGGDLLLNNGGSCRFYYGEFKKEFMKIKPKE